MKAKLAYITVAILILVTNLSYSNSLKLDNSFSNSYFNLNGIIIDYNKTDKMFSEKMIVANDSLSNKIESVWNRGNQYYVKIKLADYEQEIRLSVYNMLGKEVLLIHNGRPLPKSSDYYFDSSTLPNGIYICILEGRNIRDAEKFVVSR